MTTPKEITPEPPGRLQRMVFGEVAREYDETRSHYPPALVDAVLAYCGWLPEQIVEVGAGTGLATDVLLAIGAPIVCIEPDPAMAAILAGKFTGRVEIFAGGFEAWTPPPGRVDLIVSAQAWHWVTPADRLRLAHEALVPGGVLAVCGHQYALADDDVRAAVQSVCARIAPELVRGTDATGAPDAHWTVDEMPGSPLFTDTTDHQFETIESLPTERFIRLLNTFSRYRMLPDDQRAELFEAIAATVGDGVRQRLTTVLALGRAA